MKTRALLTVSILFVACSGGSGSEATGSSESSTGSVTGETATINGSTTTAGVEAASTGAGTSTGRDTTGGSASTGRETTGGSAASSSNGGRGASTGATGVATSASSTTSSRHHTSSTGGTTAASATGTAGGSTAATTGSGGGSSGTVGSGSGSTGASAAANNYSTQRVSKVSYGPNAQYDLMDYAYPVSPPGPTPAMVFIHGGSWQESAGYTMYDSTIGTWAAYGLFTATIDYRVLPTYTWPAMIADVRLALRYLRANAAALNIDPTRICVGGDSAGGQLALLAGYNHDPVQSWDVQSLTTEASDALCVVSMFGPTYGGPGGSNTPAQAALAYVDGGAVPTWITQGSVDTTVVPSQSIDLYVQLTDYGIPRAFYEYPGNHEFAGAPGTGPESKGAAFLDQAAWVLDQVGLPSGGLSTASQLQTCGQTLSDTATVALSDCFVSSP